MPVPDDEGNFDPQTPHGFEPSYSRLTSIPHYYGDVVRALLLGGAALMLIASPLYATSLRTEFPFEVLGAFFAVCFAALTNPRSLWVMVGDAVLAGIGALIFSAWGLIGYDTINPVAFVLRLAIAVICLFAFYYSVKTIRAMSMHIIGHRETSDEFDDKKERE